MESVVFILIYLAGVISGMLVLFAKQEINKPPLLFYTHSPSAFPIGSEQRNNRTGEVFNIKHVEYVGDNCYAVYGDKL